MKKETTKSKTTKPLFEKSLKEALIAAVHKVLKDNKAELNDKIQKTINKAIKKIIKKTDKQINKALKTK